MKKSTVEEITERFDNDVERFSNLETGQASAVDAPLCLELITSAAARLRPDATALLDIGAGAGNFTLRMLSRLPGLQCTLLDLSRPMLDRAVQRVSASSAKSVIAIQSDFRDAALAPESCDIILAGAVLHHLRDDADWERAFQKLFRILRPGGCLLISDLVAQDTEALSQLIRERYRAYLENNGGADYAARVLEIVDQEDSPRSLPYQLELMRRVGFREVEVLHKNSCFAAFGGIK
jgi:tRNA (cmo5U34)-methyltransferase